MEYSASEQRHIPFSRYKIFLYKAKNGHLLVVGNYKADMYSYYYGRNNLTAMISRDDGKTWEGFLTIDEREGSEQPDVFEGTNGFIYVSYGRDPCIAGESLLAIITEEDILEGRIVNSASQLRVLVGKIEGMKKWPITRKCWSLLKNTI